MEVKVGKCYLFLMSLGNKYGEILAKIDIFGCEKGQNLNALEKAGPNHDVRQNQRHLKHGSCWTCGQLQESDGRGTESDDKSF